MELSYFAVQLVVAILCASIANMLVPRRIPGKFLGLMLIGMLGVWLGEAGFRLLQSQAAIADWPLLAWSLLGVPLIPSVIGSVIVLYGVTSALKWGAYRR